MIVTTVNIEHPMLKLQLKISLLLLINGSQQISMTFVFFESSLLYFHWAFITGDKNFKALRLSVLIDFDAREWTVWLIWIHASSRAVESHKAANFLVTNDFELWANEKTAFRVLDATELNLIYAVQNVFRWLLKLDWAPLLTFLVLIDTILAS